MTRIHYVVTCVDRKCIPVDFVDEGGNNGIFELTQRELEILTLCADGYSDSEIAAELGISAYTVGNHLKHIYGKTNAANRIRAVVRAIDTVHGVEPATADEVVIAPARDAVPPLRATVQPSLSVSAAALSFRRSALVAMTLAPITMP
jgi:DNA-binding CsgD family transcriptional regulator